MEKITLLQSIETIILDSKDAEIVKLVNRFERYEIMRQKSIW